MKVTNDLFERIKIRLSEKPDSFSEPKKGCFGVNFTYRLINFGKKLKIKEGRRFENPGILFGGNG